MGGSCPAIAWVVILPVADPSLRWHLQNLQLETSGASSLATLIVLVLALQENGETHIQPVSGGCVTRG